MKKKFIIIGILLISIFIFLFNLETIRSTAKKYLSMESKTLVKKLFFGKETLEELERLQTYGEMNYNQKVLPETQFTNMNLKGILLHDLNLGEDSTYNKLMRQPISVTFYMEQFKDDLVIVDIKGKIFFINKQFITDSKNFDWIQVNSNLHFQNILIKDVLILNNEIYISYAEFRSEEKKCFTMNISKAKISKKELVFETFFKSKDCQWNLWTGRMVFYNHDGKEGLLLATTAVCKEIDLAQDDNSIFGKILFIDFETKNYKIFSKGHRNPQGLTVEKNFIISTEHGPIGGDEINLIQFGQNYGWPISSYGETDICVKEPLKEGYDYLKNHSDHGFIEPIYSFVPSIGINQIIKVPDNFSEYWKNNFLVISLAGNTIYRILFDQNFSKIVYHEKIFIGKRMRDIVYSEEYNVFLIALEGSFNPGEDRIPSIGILSNSLNK